MRRSVTIKVCSLTLLPLIAFAMPAYSQAKRPGQTSPAEYGRNYDLRLTISAPPIEALSPQEAIAVERWRSAVPDLLFKRDDRTGATRSLANPVDYLTGPRAGASPEAVAADFLNEELDVMGLTAADLSDYRVEDAVYSKVSGVTHLYLNQRLNGIPVYNGLLNINIGRDLEILSVNSQFVPNLAGAVNTRFPSITAIRAVEAVAVHLEDATFNVASEATLAILPIGPGQARLVWNFQVETADSNHWYDMTVDAVDGRIWTRIDWVAEDDYKVYEQPAESPNHTTPLPPADGRTTPFDPADATASPFGWHDTNGAAGAEFTIMRGNNVHAYDDIGNNNAPSGPQPDCGGALNCSFPIDLTMAPNTYIGAAVANLFYWNNIIHDVAYRYGFDEAGGNFQENNYGNGGAQSDYVQAEAQDGAGTNNANFGTPPDGINPRMQMFIWTAPAPDRDGDLDAGIIVHEYGHGISNRLVGGPGNVSCLGVREQPGEGLSDWWFLFFTYSDPPAPVRGVGTYAENEPTNGPGIRTQRYDWDPEPNTNTFTYSSINGLTSVHRVGEVWGQVYWMVTGALVREHGFDQDIYNYTGNSLTSGDPDKGNVRAMKYIIEGLQNTACWPGFVDVRDGILAAAASNYGGEDVCLMWEIFASFGLGARADQGSANSTSDQTEAFDVPAACVDVVFTDGFESGNLSAWSSTSP